MKKLVLTLLTFALAFGTINAQYGERRGNQKAQKQAMKQRNGGGQRANGAYGGGINQLYRELSLSASQQSRADQINENLKHSVQSLRSNSYLSQDQKQRELMTLIQRNQSEFRSILNYQQAQRYDQLVSQFQQRGRRTPGNMSYQTPNSGYQTSNASPNLQSLLGLLGGNSSLLNILGGNLSLGSILGGGNSSSLLNILGSNISLDTILSLISGFTQSR